ncbi:MAG: hypothetical protein KBT63_04470 [Porticoccaceae bacterium]|nr:hypothetical protein [Porticoccaceae bacterium]
MPKWGLTPDQIASKPWGLGADDIAPCKTITDPIHGDIYLNNLEKQLADSVPMQRLRRVRQLGTTHLIYPGATHSRFSHSLGALRVVQDLLDAVLTQQNSPHAVNDLFMEFSPDKKDYNLIVAEATILARLGGLLHDLCHVPFGHSVEDDLDILVEHDENEDRFNFLWNQIDEPIRNKINPGLFNALKPLIISKGESSGDQPLCDTKYAFVADIVGNTICADLLDYLKRDHFYTGLPAQLGQRFIDGFYVTPSTNKSYPAKMVMRVSKDGHERSDIISELFKYLRYRYELSERVLVHHTKISADAMIGKILEMWKDVIFLQKASELYKKECKSHGDNIEKLREKIVTQFEAGSVEIQRIDEEVKQVLEKNFLSHGDDGLIEYIIGEMDRSGSDKREQAVLSLAEKFQNRKLFKVITKCSNVRSQAETLYKNFGKAKERRRLEEGACEFAGIDHSWHILIWLPNPKMRLKAAEVLVEDSYGIQPLIDKERVGKHRGNEIYEGHRSLWAITVFAPPHVKDDNIKRCAALSWLAQEMGITWDEDVQSLSTLAAQQVGYLQGLTRDQEETLSVALDRGVAARGDFSSKFSDIVDRAGLISKGLFPNESSGAANIPGFENDRSEDDFFE